MIAFSSSISFSAYCHNPTDLIPIATGVGGQILISFILSSPPVFLFFSLASARRLGARADNGV